ncbi:arsenosugar biosynthesis radical SAM (seleno)protein ArsS [Saccharophagus degradans]|uniref:Radical SAM n=1 Tax=Saccharophagus degradans (strain 2-40 / ATCC 43961 / DSM 17024) TaxID=203122 RepID=Q21IJ8_SACD2|nr:arsenosugar biosynthesis radical SAM (seleno)protein ArsS [Saccharophagus degradans]ABD81481.1 Radical SAM [Saccharophagus degradans 2-40]
MLDTKPLLLNSDFPAINRGALSVLQVNLGYLCNLSCTHCHVNAGPKRTELASLETISAILAYIDLTGVTTLDLTGGAPEMNPHFKYLVREASARNVTVIDRCNLTILNEPGYEDLAEFLALHQVVVSASLPCYSEKNVNEQRGKGVFGSSITALQKLNKLGYGTSENLSLNLVYNPNGPFLPPSQQALQQDYKQKLAQDFGISFNELLTITNMPISRFGSMLLSKGLYEDYLQLLKDNFSAANLAGVMCKNLISIDWQGYVYDCDFNQMLDMPLQTHSAGAKGMIASDAKRTHISDLLQQDITGNPIVIGDHCYGCTAGQGSSCGGALA